MLNAKLVVVGGDAQQKEVRLKQLPTIIGRGRDVNLTLPHPLVSRVHCEIFEKQGYLYVKDLESLNGTYVNNIKIENERILEPNQLLTLGNVTFRAVYQPRGVKVPVAADASDETFRVTNRPTKPDRRPISNISELETERVGLRPSDTDHDDPSDQLKTVHKRRTVHQSDPHTGKPAGPHIKSGDELVDGFDLAEDSKIRIEDEENIPPDKSVSLSALRDLPSDSRQASFAGGIEIGQPPAVVDDPESVRIDLGQEGLSANEFSQSKLDSFVRKLPK